MKTFRERVNDQGAGQPPIMTRRTVLQTPSKQINIRILLQVFLPVPVKCLAILAITVLAACCWGCTLLQPLPCYLTRM